MNLLTVVPFLVKTGVLELYKCVGPFINVHLINLLCLVPL
jgi:hypothetical protein